MADVRVRTDYPFDVGVVEHVWVPLSDGTRLAAKLWLPRRRRARAGRLLLPPVPQERRCRGRRRPGDALFRGPRLCGSADRHPRDRRFRRDHRGRVHGARAARRRRGDRLDRRAALVRRLRRHDRVLLGRLLEPPARRPAAARVEGGHELLRLRRPLRRRRPLQGRLRARDGDAPLGDLHARLQRDAARPAVRRGRVARPWLHRLERTPPFIEPWLSHQRRDAYWKHGSVCEDYTASAAPSTRSAAGRTATRMPCCACSSTFPCRARA